jgi:hypothetical protein
MHGKVIHDLGKNEFACVHESSPSEDERGKHHAGAGTSQVGNTHESLFYIVKTLT